MSIDHPSPRIRQAIEAAAAWYDQVKIVDKKSLGATDAEGKRDRILADSPGSVTWARFYDLETMKPMFAGRDSVPHSDLGEIERERRTGYSWYGPWGGNVAREYRKWKARQ
jgi:PelA/Pel-15E family pectate lyase